MPTSGSQLNVMIDEDKREALKNRVRGQGRTVSDVINEFIDHYLLSDDMPNQPNLDKLVKLAVTEQLEKVKGDSENPITEDYLNEVIATALDPIMMKLDALTSRIRELEGEGGEYHVNVDVESSPVEEVEEVEGMRAATLAQIFEVEERGMTNLDLSKRLNLSVSTLEKWKKAIANGKIIQSRRFDEFVKSWKLGDDYLWYPLD